MTPSRKPKPLPCAACPRRSWSDIPSSNSKPAEPIGGLSRRKYARLSHKLTKHFSQLLTNNPPSTKTNKKMATWSGWSPKEIFLTLKDPSLLDDDLIKIFSKRTTLTNTTHYNHLATNITLILLLVQLPNNNASPPSSP